MDEFRRMKEREQKAKEAELEYYRELAQLDEDESAWYWHLCQDAWNQEDIRIKITRYYAEPASDPILRTLRLIDLVFDVTRFSYQVHREKK